MKLFNNSNNISKLIINRLNKYTTQQFPYVNELYNKNYIKYPTQSKQAVTHDYVFDGSERLPSLAERLKGNNYSNKKRFFRIFDEFVLNITEQYMILFGTNSTRV
jgi:hypothetical protein